MFNEYRDSITLYVDGVSSKEVNIHVIKSNILSSPSPRREFEDVPGRNGSLLIDEGCYDDFTLELECCLVNEGVETLANIARRAKKYLQSAINSRLQTDEDLEFYLTGTYISRIDILEAIENFGTFQVQFRCSPFRKQVSQSSILIEYKGQQILNPFYEAKPYFRIEGNGDITININEQELILKGVETYIEVDSEMMECFKGPDPQNSKMYSPFPILEEGVNVISWTGTVNKLVIEPNRGVI